MNPHDMQRVLSHLKRDPVVKAVYDAKSEEIGPNIFRFKAEIGAGGSRGWAVCASLTTLRGAAAVSDLPRHLHACTARGAAGACQDHAAS